MKPAAFQATIHGFRTVPSRGVVSITIEAPIEHHAEIARIAVHGAWVAVARLEEQKEEVAKPAKDKKHWRDMPPSQQAAIRCHEPVFRAFLETKGYAPTDDNDAAEAVRDLFGIPSRTDLNRNQHIMDAWHKFDDEFVAWKTLEGVT